ncbi:MAG TPA: LacI family DNA-binding transcriptional regulator [Trueperaceae bacterium]|nr:LacI family DNA-binding transcriptional regulator [Trueperaceae bacterium]
MSEALTTRKRASRATVTISAVAKHAGVSVGTVSRVLNNADNIGSDVRLRVRKAMDALGYVPNHAARSLKRRLTRQIALVVPDLANPVYTQMAVGVQREAAASGYHLTLVNSGGDWAEERLALQSLEERQVDGAILCSLRVTPGFIRSVTSHADRVCVIGGLPLDCPVDNVRLDSVRGAELAVAHLLASGRSKIAFMNGTVGTVPFDARARGYRSALEQAGVEFDGRLVVSGDFTMAGGYGAVDLLRDQGAGFDGLLCANDAMALGAMRRLQELGVDVPADVAVVGMDDIEAARMSTPTLTTVALLARERGRIACELLLRRLGDGSAGEPEKITVLPKLIERESTAVT